ncbi:hypothetical protein CASFOL_003354 [Castilleja foliolosa]|uniref:Uncharacterized protein n=1 Tax=Castilleja foliolosa TaxID=1961234 RepID=A0ABD3EH86_9LAMI
MSADRSTPQADLSSSTSEKEKKDQAFFDAIEMLQQVRLCELWTPESDFLKVCSCDECRPKIQRLNQFEEEIQSKQNLIGVYIGQLDSKEWLCFNICTSAQWTKDMFGFLNKKLKRISEELGVSCTLEKSSSADELELVDKQIVQRLTEVGLLRKSVDSGATGEYDEDDDDILGKLETARWYYRKTKVKDEVYALLQDIENLENDWDWEMDNKTVEAQKLGKQIELMEKFPMKELQNEVEELIAELFPREPHEMKEKKAKKLIHKVSYSCIRKRKDFWEGSPLPTQGNEHCSNGLEETLDSLLQEVNVFNEQWNKEFAPIFTRPQLIGPQKATSLISEHGQSN